MIGRLGCHRAGAGKNGLSRQQLIDDLVKSSDLELGAPEYREQIRRGLFANRWRIFVAERQKGHRRRALLRSGTTNRLREVPEGFNGSALRDLAAEGQIQAVLMYSPDDEQCPQAADPLGLPMYQTFL